MGSPRLSGRLLFYLNLLLGSQPLQVALNVEQYGVQHVKDPEDQGAVRDSRLSFPVFAGAGGHWWELKYRTSMGVEEGQPCSGEAREKGCGAGPKRMGRQGNGSLDLQRLGGSGSHGGWMKSGNIKWDQTNQSTGPEERSGWIGCRHRFRGDARTGHRGEDRVRQEAHRP